MTSQFMSSLLAGAAAGTSVDVALFPIDTIKVCHSRFQNGEGQHDTAFVMHANYLHRAYTDAAPIYGGIH